MYVAIDVGGTKTLLTEMTEDGQIKQKLKFPTPKDYAEFLANLEKGLADWGKPSYQAAAIAIPDVDLNRQTGVATGYGNLPWKNTPVKADLERLVGCPVTVENDAKAGGLSEALLIKDEFSRVLYVTIGTGIGYAYIVDGVIDTNLNDAGGRSLMIEYQGVSQPWESLASGSAIVKRYGQRASEITDPDTWQQIASLMHLGISELLEVVAPQAIVIGGGVGSHFDSFSGFLSELLQRQPPLAGPVPVLRQAQRPEEAVIYGCYELIKHSLNESGDGQAPAAS